MRIVIIKYNAGNIQSVLFALQRIGEEANVTGNLNLIKKSDKVIFPGVGEASTAMAYLKEKGLDQVIVRLEQPLLGICLGMQLLCASSQENNTKCLGIFEKTDVKKFTPPDNLFKVPQIGWNNIYDCKGKLFTDIPDMSYCYFVHGYYANLGPNTIAKTHYIHPYCAAIQKNNFYGVQFHPEKSAETGDLILKNFLSL